MRHLIPLGEGVYTITEACRILQPTMTRAKVHYWLNTGLLSEPPVVHAGRGVPTLLTFRQLLEIRTVQYLRDELRVSLPRVRAAFEWVLASLFAEGPTEVRFELGPGPELIATRGDGDSVVVPSGQRVLPTTTMDMINETMHETAVAWRRQAFTIPRHPRLVTDAHISAGSPTIAGTRIDTAVVAAFVGDVGEYTADTIARIRETYPRLPEEAIEEALQFEGHRRAA